MDERGDVGGNDVTARERLISIWPRIFRKLLSDRLQIFWVWGLTLLSNQYNHLSISSKKLTDDVSSNLLKTNNSSYLKWIMEKTGSKSNALTLTLSQLFITVSYKNLEIQMSPCYIKLLFIIIREEAESSKNPNMYRKFGLSLGSRIQLLRRI